MICAVVVCQGQDILHNSPIYDCVQILRTNPKLKYVFEPVSRRHNLQISNMCTNFQQYLSMRYMPKMHVNMTKNQNHCILAGECTIRNCFGFNILLIKIIIS